MQRRQEDHEKVREEASNPSGKCPQRHSSPLPFQDDVFNDAMIYATDTAAYFKAIAVCPSVVESESPKSMFLRFCEYDVWKASQRLANYWTIRVEIFGAESAFLPLALALHPGDMQNSLQGKGVVLPANKDGRYSMLWDRTRMQGAIPPNEFPQRLRCNFLHYQQLMMLSSTTSNPFEVMLCLKIDLSRILRFDSDKKIAKCVRRLTSTAMCLHCYNHMHFITVFDEVNRPSLVSRLLPSLVTRVAGWLEQTPSTLHSGTTAAVLASMQASGFYKEGIPDTCGGLWSYEKDWKAFLQRSLSVSSSSSDGVVPNAATTAQLTVRCHPKPTQPILFAGQINEKTQQFAPNEQRVEVVQSPDARHDDDLRHPPDEMASENEDIGDLSAFEDAGSFEPLRLAAQGHCFSSRNLAALHAFQDLPWDRPTTTSPLVNGRNHRIQLEDDDAAALWRRNRAELFAGKEREIPVVTEKVYGDQLWGNSGGEADSAAIEEDAGCYPLPAVKFGETSGGKHAICSHHGDAEAYRNSKDRLRPIIDTTAGDMLSPSYCLDLAVQSSAAACSGMRKARHPGELTSELSAQETYEMTTASSSSSTGGTTLQSAVRHQKPEQGSSILFTSPSAEPRPYTQQTQVVSYSSSLDQPSLSTIDKSLPAVMFNEHHARPSAVAKEDDDFSGFEDADPFEPLPLACSASHDDLVSVPVQYHRKMDVTTAGSNATNLLLDETIEIVDKVLCHHPSQAEQVAGIQHQDIPMVAEKVYDNHLWDDLVAQDSDSPTIAVDESWDPLPAFEPCTTSEGKDEFYSSNMAAVTQGVFGISVPDRKRRNPLVGNVMPNAHFNSNNQTRAISSLESATAEDTLPRSHCLDVGELDHVFPPSTNDPTCSFSSAEQSDKAPFSSQSRSGKACTKDIERPSETLNTSASPPTYSFQTTTKAGEAISSSKSDRRIQSQVERIMAARILARRKRDAKYRSRRRQDRDRNRRGMPVLPKAKSKGGTGKRFKKII